MVSGHRIEKKIPVEEFLETLTNYNREDIFCTKHTFFRLSEEQRNVFKCDTIRDFLLGQTPKLVGVQFNQLYAVFYPHKKGEFIRIVLDIHPRKIEVVTFYILDPTQLPRL